MKVSPGEQPLPGESEQESVEVAPTAPALAPDVGALTLMSARSSTSCSSDILTATSVIFFRASAFLCRLPRISTGNTGWLSTTPGPAPHQHQAPLSPPFPPTHQQHWESPLQPPWNMELFGNSPPMEECPSLNQGIGQVVAGGKLCYGTGFGWEWSQNEGIRGTGGNSMESWCWGSLQQHPQLWRGRIRGLLASAFTLSISASNATSRSMRLERQGEMEH